MSDPTNIISECLIQRAILEDKFELNNEQKPVDLENAVNVAEDDPLSVWCSPDQEYQLWNKDDNRERPDDREEKRKRNEFDEGLYLLQSDEDARNKR